MAEPVIRVDTTLFKGFFTVRVVFITRARGWFVEDSQASRRPQGSQVEPLVGALGKVRHRLAWTPVWVERDAHVVDGSAKTHQPADVNLVPCASVDEAERPLVSTEHP